MYDFNNEYYFITDDHNDEKLPILTPDEDAANRPFEYEAMPVGSSPLIFHDGGMDRKKRKNIKPYDPPPEILFSGTDVVVQASLRETLWKLEIPNLAFNESIYIDHKEVWHENLWYLAFIERFDCWDRKLSDYEHDPLVIGNVALHHVYKYALNNELLAKTPLQKRLLFKMGNASPGYVVAHASIAKYFRKPGAIVLPIKEYGDHYP